MSYTSIDQSTKDQRLVNRVIAGVQKEARTNPTFGNTDYGRLVVDNPAEGIALIWPVAIDYETQYESALVAGNPDPGGDPAVITDANIGAAVQAHWPPDAP